MQSLIKKICETKDCIVLPPSGSPTIKQSHFLPRDLTEFYTLCGGIKLYKNSNYSVEIMPPQSVVLANPVILPDGWESYIPPDDISYNWYLIAEAGPEQRISIDLSHSTSGRCYDSFWDIHACPGDSPILACSFTELLESLYKSRGDYWFWLSNDFHVIGDAYD